MESRRETSSTAVIHHPDKYVGLRSTPDCSKENRAFRLTESTKDIIYFQELPEFKSNPANDFACWKQVYTYPCKIENNWKTIHIQHNMTDIISFSEYICKVWANFKVKT